LEAVASGLMMEKVRSMAMVGLDSVFEVQDGYGGAIEWKQPRGGRVIAAQHARGKMTRVTSEPSARLKPAKPDIFLV